MAVNTVFITTGTTYTIPADFISLVAVHAIGGGGGGGRGTRVTGGGGGAYSASTAITGLAANQTVYVRIGTGPSTNVAGGDTWFNTTNVAPTSNTTGVLAKGGGGGTTGPAVAGGAAASGVGTTRFSGGGANSVSGTSRGGAGGAGGPGGNGGTGAGGSGVQGGGGSGAGTSAAGTNASGSTGGTAPSGGGRGGNSSSNGQPGSVWTQTSNGALAGPGGGGGGGSVNGGAGGLYGGGAGGAGSTRRAAGSGVIVFQYNAPTLLTTAYWVGGSGTWNTANTANWASTSGGAGGAGTVNATTDVIIDGASGSPTITLSGAITAKSLTTTGSTCTFTSTGALTVSGNITLSATTTWSATASLTIGASSTITAPSTTFACSITSAFSVTLGANLTLGTTNTFGFTAGTLTLSTFTLSTGVFSSTTGTRTFAFGTGNITTRGSGTAFNVTGANLTLTGTPTVNIANNSATATTVIAPSFTEINAFNINYTTGTYALTETANNVYRSLNYTGFTGTISGIATKTLYGNITVSSGMGSIVNNALTFSATSGTQLITSNGKTFPAITINGGGTVQLQDAFTSNGNLLLSRGTFDANNFNVTAGVLIADTTNTRTLIMGSGTWTLSGSGTAWNIGTTTGLTFDKGTANIVLSNTSTTTSNTFFGGGLTYNNLTIGGGTATAPVIFTGSNTFAKLSTTRTVAYTITFPSGQTTTITDWQLSGTSATALLTINSSTAGTPAIISQASGTIDAFWLSLKDSTATGGATWNAYASTDVSGNTNWNFLTFSGFYWVGGSGTWAVGSTTQWAITSGGTATSGSPNSTTDVFVDSNSGSPTITLSGSVTAKSITTTGATCTFTGTGTLTVSGDITLSATTTWSATGLLTFNTTSTITTNGVSIASPITLSGNSTTYTLGSTLTTTGTFTWNPGTGDNALIFNNFNLTCFSFINISSSLRTLTVGTGVINVTGAAQTVFNSNSNATTFTTTPTVNFTYSGSIGTRIINGLNADAVRAFDMNVSAGADIINLIASPYDFNTTGFTGTLGVGTGINFWGSLTIGSGTTTAVGTNTLAFSATTGTQTITTNGVTINFPISKNAASTLDLNGNTTLSGLRTFNYTSGTLNLNNNTLSTGVFTSTSGTRVIQFGTGNITTTGTGSAFTVNGTNLTYTGTPTINISNNSATQVTVTTATFTESNAFDVNITTGTYILTETAANVYKNLNYTGFNGTIPICNRIIYGNYTIPATGATLAAGATTTVFNASSGIQIITTNGRTLDFPITKVGSGTLQLAGALTISSRTYALSEGTLDLNNFTLTVGNFLSNLTATRSIAFGTGGQINISGSGTAWNMATSTGFSYTGTGQIALTNATSATFDGGNGSFPHLILDNIGVYTISGSNTFTSITNSGNTLTLTLTSGSTTTVDSFGLSGSAGNVVTLNSSTVGSQATLFQAAGTVSVSYMDIIDSNATGGATWEAFLTNDNVDNGNNTGWLFVAAPIGSSGNFFMLF